MAVIFTVLYYTLLAYLSVGLIVGLIATYQNRNLFRRATKRYLRLAAHAADVELLWPILGPLVISVPLSRQRPNYFRD